MSVEGDVLRLYEVPLGLLETSATELHTVFPKPTIIHLEGCQPEPLFVSVLLHGNETTGLSAVQTLLQDQAGKPWPRAVSFFFGNVRAAQEGVRRLDGQPDFNRIWPGTDLDECKETRWAQFVVAEMSSRGVFASIDVHNNTGRNPHYACVERLDGESLNLGVMFDRLVIYSPHPKGSQTGAFANICPSVMLECGLPGEASGVEHAVEFIQKCLRLDEIPRQPPPTQGIDLFHTVAQVTVRDEVNFSFSNSAADLLLRDELDLLNFTELPLGTLLGRVNRKYLQTNFPLLALTENGQDIATTFFRIDNNSLLVLAKPAMPCMLPTNERIVRQDCLCYLMERLEC